VRDRLDEPQLAVMGRVTYEVLAALSSATDEASTRMNELPKAVFSNTLSEPLAWANTRLLRGDLAERVRALKGQSAAPLRTIGSITLVRSLLHLGLVDRLRITAFPLLLPFGWRPLQRYGRKRAIPRDEQDPAAEVLMVSRLTEIAVDCHDPAAQATFWANVLGYQVVHSGDDWVEIAPWKQEPADLAEQVRQAPSVPTLVFAPVPEGKTVKNRLHLDVSPIDRSQEAEVERLVGLGARHADVGQGTQTWVVLADPEGNEFCVLRSLAAQA